MRDIANETIVKNVLHWEDYDFHECKTLSQDSPDSKKEEDIITDNDDDDLI